MIIATNKYTKEYWDKINETRRAFQDWINYEWNYAVHISFHKHYETNTKITEKLVIAYLK